MANYLISVTFNGGDTAEIKKLMRETAKQWGCGFVAFDNSIAGTTFCAQHVADDSKTAAYIIWSICAIVNTLIPKEDRPTFYAEKVFKLVQE